MAAGSGMTDDALTVLDRAGTGAQQVTRGAGRGG